MAPFQPLGGLCARAAGGTLAGMRPKTSIPILCLALCAPALAGPPGGGGVDEAAAAQRWVGTVEGSAVRSTRWVSGGSSSHGDFFFTVRNGRVSGEAVLAYKPQFDANRLDGLIAYAKGLTGAALGLVPYFGGFAANDLNKFIGVRASFDPTVVRRVRIQGTLRNGKLALDTVGGNQKGVPFKAAIITLKKKDEALTGGRLVAPQPFVRAGEVSAGHAISTHASSVRDNGGVTEKTSSYWTAHRVG